MKKFDFKKLALVGITGGVMCATYVNGTNYTQPKTGMDTQTTTPTAMHTTMDETHFINKLNAEGKEMYMKMNQEGKTLALKMGNSGDYTDMNDAVKAAYKQWDAKTNHKNHTH
jgi:hypothetical protein